MNSDESLSIEGSKFRSVFLEEAEKVAKKSGDELRLELHGKSIKISDKFWNVEQSEKRKFLLPSDSIGEGDIKEFLSKLKLFVDQPNESQLDKIIKDKIQDRYKVTTQGDINTIFSKVSKRVEGWWKEGKESYYLTEKYDYFGEEKSYLDDLKRPPAEDLPERWQFPIKNDNFVGRGLLLNNINERLSANNIVTLVPCHGLGGVGKTQLALEFIWSNYQKYKGVIWFDAKDKNTLTNDYIKLGRELNIIRDGEEKVPEEERINRVKRWLEEHAGWLMVCDNAPNYKEIADLLPKKGGKILVTSRYEFGWPQPKNNILVDVFKSEESRSCIRKILEVKGQELDMTQVDKLAETLGHLPLALAQASAYMKKTAMNISDYLQLYKDKKQALLSNEALLETFPAGSNRETAAVVYVTWDITMEAIRKESSLAANWFTACAYLGNRAIPSFLLESFAGNPENNISSEISHTVLGILKSYSMLTVNEDRSMSVHNLVQEVTRLKSEEEGKTQEDLKKVLKLVKNDIMMNPRSSVDHAASAWGYVDKYDGLVKEFSKLPSRIISKLDDSVRYGEAYLFGKRASKLLGDKLGPDHPDTLTTRNNMAGVLYKQGKYEEAFQSYKEVYEIWKRELGPDHSGTLTAQNNMAAVFDKQGKYDEALQAYEEVYECAKESV